MESMINLLANIAANAEAVDACVVAVIMKPTDERPTPDVEVLTVGENAVQMFGISEFIRHEIYKQLQERP